MKIDKKSDKYYVGITSHKINHKNPFIESTQFEMEISTTTKVVAGNREAINNLIVDRETGEMIGHQALVVKKKVDKDQFTKIFHNGLAAMWGLNKAGIRVFTYIASIVKPNSDFIYFEMSDAKIKTEYKNSKSVLQGLSQLLDAQFIARTEVHYKYYINPTFFFNGNRLTLVNHYEVDPSIKPNKLKEEQVELKLKLRTRELPLG